MQQNLVMAAVKYSQFTESGVLRYENSPSKAKDNVSTEKRRPFHSDSVAIPTDKILDDSSALKDEQKSPVVNSEGTASD